MFLTDHSESWHVRNLCNDLLTSAEVRELCLARGFPLVSGSKEELAASATVRFLDPVGVARAMATLDSTWLKVVHLAVACGRPVGLSEIHNLIGPSVSIYHVDWRALWKQVTGGLLAKGVALAVDGDLPHAVKSRFAAYHVTVPAAFHSFLPPFPIATEKVGVGKTETLDGVLQGALNALIVGVGAGHKGARRTTAELFAHQLSIKGGVLRLAAIEHPTGTKLANAVVDAWRESLGPPSKREPLPPGPMADHVLRHLPAHSACSAPALHRALGVLGFDVETDRVRAFCEKRATSSDDDRNKRDA